MKLRSSLQLTLAVLKPDLMTNPARLQSVKEKILKEKFWILRWSILHWQRKDAELFYQEHRGKFFIQRLTSFMSRAKLSHPDSIRGMYGVTDTRNATHGSDSVKTAEKEMKFFFPDFDSTNWMKNHADEFENGKVAFDEQLQIHKVELKK